MKISMHTAHLFERLGVDEGFAALKRNGVDGIQFGMGYYLMPAQSVRANKPAAMDAPLDEVIEMVRPYKEAAQRHDVCFSQVHAPFPMWDIDNETLNARMPEIIKKSIAVTAYVDCPHVIVHPAYSKDDTRCLSAQDEWELNKRLYAAMIPDLKKYKVTCLLENLFARGAGGMCCAGACVDAFEAARWIDELNAMAGEELFGFNLDTGHYALARQNPGRAARVLGKRLKALHLQDNSGHFDQHLAPYMGTVDWESFLAALRDIGYQGDLNFETGSVLGKFPAEMTEECIHLTASIGRYFIKRITE